MIGSAKPTSVADGPLKGERWEAIAGPLESPSKPLRFHACLNDVHAYTLVGATARAREWK